jgi:transposase
MKVPTKFVKTLSEEEHSRLSKNHQNGENFRVRNRSHAILLSAEGFAIAAIAKICRVDRDTVSLWIDNWQQNSFNSLEDDERSGRPPILTAEEQAKAIEIAMQNPRFPHRQLSAIKKETGKEISKFTLKDLIKKKTSFGKESS